MFLSAAMSTAGVILGIISAGQADYAVEFGLPDAGGKLEAVSLILLVSGLLVRYIARRKDGQG